MIVRAGRAMGSPKPLHGHLGQAGGHPGLGWWHRDAGTAGAHTGAQQVWCGGEVAAITVLK